ncbi:esterase/lipase family protein [Thermoanaerobacterium thermosaccharolyticum]|uniref:Lecithin--cholesterol acyltransferase n=1 Tax=Thermoanaerobacterium thermosaccharolyticum TaxID=1517 RepID=A0A231VBA3_THETR|nr:lecithin--cholesterol acyltransferase [Thermoanaerobacterium thermosaccharolyticum]OXT05211.1 lecithin--cholesterol acyltransferase [Thermoanaerobacterium thermosaccharolyticum]
MRLYEVIIMRRPLVFVHGIFGSIYVPTLVGKAWGFGPAGYIYDSFINNLKTLGYTEGKNLFICYYEWWKDIPECVNTLMSKINEAKIKNNCDKVDVACHSMGGLLLRSYVQGDFYRNDVDKIIFLSSPHYGAANAYYAWEGGAVPPDNDEDFLNILLRGFIWAIGKIKGEKDELMIIRKYIPSIKCLLPTHEYGNYVFKYPIKNNKILFKNILYMKEQNDFLNELNYSIDRLYERANEIYVFSGNGIYTNKFIQVTESDDDIVWPDGRAVGVVRDDKGDGTVLIKSALGVNGNQHVLDAGHGGILNASIPDLKEIFGVEEAPKVSLFEKITSFVNILTDSKVIVLDRGQKLKKYNIFGKVNWYMSFNEEGEYHFSSPDFSIRSIMIHTNKGFTVKTLKPSGRYRNSRIDLFVDKNGNFDIKR